MSARALAFHQRLSAFSIVFSIALAFSTLFFILTTTDPLLVQDGWYYLDVFFSRAIEGQLAISDFFIRRGGFDHSQPLYKLIYLIELRRFDLDFTPQAVVGFFSALGIAWISFLAIKGKKTLSEVTSAQWFGLSALLTCVVSLNSTEIWTWPDVTIQYISFFCVILFFLVLATIHGSSRLLLAGLTSLLVTLAASDVAVLAVAAVFAVFLVQGVRVWRSDAKPMLLVIAIFILTETVLYWATPVIGGTPSSQGAGVSLENLSECWKWIVLPLANSVIAKDNLALVFPKYLFASQLVISCLMILAHLAFWRAFFRSEKVGVYAFASYVMLFFYALVLGIVVGRVGRFGADYLNSPRYVLYYQFNLIALIVMSVSHFDSRRAAGLVRVGFTMIFIAWFALQVPLSNYAWESAPYHRLAYVKIASQVDAIRKNPSSTPTGCAPELPLCTMSEANRIRLIGLLYSRKLNIYSNKFRAMHGFISS